MNCYGVVRVLLLGGSSIENLSGEVARLAGLISRLECKVSETMMAILCSISFYCM